jgi:prepilin signal peptidase PulO-like enzyme (type II secretory pathway)
MLMELLTALLGLTLGGFLNLLTDSLPVSRAVHAPRCEHCTAPWPPRAWLAWSALISGEWHCRYCGQPRRVRGLLVEAFMVFAAVGLFLSTSSIRDYLSDLTVAFIFLLMLIIDLEHRLVLHMVSLPAACAVAAIGFLDPQQGLQRTLIGGAAGFGAVLVMYLIGGLFSKIVAVRRGGQPDEIALGFGDVTLSTVIGLSVGYPGVLVALFLGVLAAGEFSLIYLLSMVLGRKYVAFTAIPYGPFLVLGASLVYFGGGDLVRVLFPWGPVIFLVFLVVVFLLWSRFNPKVGESDSSLEG